MNKKTKILFSKRFEIKGTQESFDFLDVYVNADSLFFVDAARIKYESTRKSEYQYLFIRMQEKIDSFFNKVLSLYETLDKDDAANEAIFKSILGYAKETQATHLGFGKIDSPGKGSSFEILKDAFDYIYTENLLEQGVISDFEELTLFTENFAYDRMSDFIISLILPELAEFTLIQAKKHKVKDMYYFNEPYTIGHAWDVEHEKWVLFKERALSNGGKPVLLIPINIISRTFLYDPKKYLSHTLYRRQDDYRNMDSEYNTIKKDGTVKPPSHDKIKDIEIRDLDLSTKRYLIQRTLADKKLKSSFADNISHIVANGSAVLTADEIEAYRIADEKKDK